MDKKNAARQGSTERKASEYFSFPKKKNTVTAKILSHLLAGKSITQLDATFHFHTTRLSGVIHSLRHIYGWQIESQEEQVTAGDGHKATIARYRLSPEQIAAAKAKLAEGKA